MVLDSIIIHVLGMSNLLGKRLLRLYFCILYHDMYGGFLISSSSLDPWEHDQNGSGTSLRRLSFLIFSGSV